MSDKFAQWWYECQLIHHKENQLKKQLAAALIVLASEWENFDKKHCSTKRYWNHPVQQLRKHFGLYEAIFPTLDTSDDMFRINMRMSLNQFENLLHLVGPLITKKFVVKIPIPAGARLAMTLRYLATGNCITSNVYSHLVSLTSAIIIIRETCEVIWTVLVNTVMPGKLTKENWLKISDGFETRWNFNHCIGAIDGKRIEIECSEHSGSMYSNYKHYHSIHFLGVCDYDYNFIFVDIGAPGHDSNGGVFTNSPIHHKLSNNLMNVPEPSKLTVDGLPLPYVLVGDEAFQLDSFLMRPYPERDIDSEKRIYNFRLARARRTIENTFGIVVQRWRVLKKPIECCRQNAVKIVKAVACLHNWLKIVDNTNDYMPENIDENILNNELKYSALNELNLRSSNFRTVESAKIRNEFCRYFNGEGRSTI